MSFKDFFKDEGHIIGQNPLKREDKYKLRKNNELVN
jgi:hypothetical protein